MTTCEKIQPRLTAYLDGELADEPGSIVRGHLRECAACRQVARDEASLRDGLRELPPVDPPPSMWAGIQAQLAAAEVADAHKPAWRRLVAKLAPSRWSRWVPTLPQLAGGSLLAAAAVLALTLHARHGVEETSAPPIAVAPVAPPRIAPPVNTRDVTADLQAEPAKILASYDQAADELIKLAEDARPGWSDEHKAAFDSRVAALRGEIAHAAGGPHGQQRAQRALIRYLQGAVVRDDIMLASGGAR